MSSGHHLQSQLSGNGRIRIGEIDHQSQLSENFSSLCMNQEYSDLTLIVGGENLYVHKVVLAARSEYFRALLYGGLKESSQTEITFPDDTPLKAFTTLLKYIYTGHMFLMTHQEDLILDVLGLAHQYCFYELQTAVSDILRQLLAHKNVCAILDTACLYGLDQLVTVCHAYLDKNSNEILAHESFSQLSKASLIDLLQRDSFFAPEVEIFKGVSNWCKAKGDPDNEVMNHVRLPLMNVADLLSVVRPSGLVKPDTLLDAIAERTSSRLSNLPYRGQLIVDENIACSKFGARVISGEIPDAILDGDTANYDMERGYTRHAINGVGDSNITVRLGTPFIINHISMLLWDQDLRSYSYYIETSMDQKDWVRVIDYSNYSCRSWQFLYFESRVVQYIKVVGTHNTVNKVFHLVALQAMCKTEVPDMVKDIICPKENIATVKNSATVIEGVSRSRNALLNGDIKHYNWDFGYTCHQLGSGAILIQLGQPYIISSLRLLLWDCDDRSYSYYIESSVNIWDWNILVDRSRESCQSWQVIRFTPRPVVFIRIVGSHNTANEVFHCVHFECPSEDDVDSNSWKDKAKPSIESPKKEVQAPDQAQQTETATEADELTVGLSESVDQN